MTLLDSFVFCAIIMVPIFLISWFVPMPKHPITIIREKNEKLHILISGIKDIQADNLPESPVYQQCQYILDKALTSEDKT